MTTPAAKPSEDSEQAVGEANRSFYLAFAALDLEQMEAVWLHEDWVKCVHPGWGLLLGWEEVRQSWAGIFLGAQRVQVEISDVTVHLEGDVAWVACTERVTTTFESGFDQVRTQATNIFVRRTIPETGGAGAARWYLVAHHASPVAPASPAPLQ